jgi:hypothetical protein
MEIQNLNLKTIDININNLYLYLFLLIYLLYIIFHFKLLIKFQEFVVKILGILIKNINLNV